MKGPEFLIYIRPLIEVLKNSGGSGITSDIIDQVIEYMDIPEEKLAETISSGASRVRNQIQWARMYLVKAGFMDSSKRGIWKLTEKAYETQLDEDKIYDLFKMVQGSSQKKQKEEKYSQSQDNNIEDVLVEDEAHGDVLIRILKQLSPSGFEKLCKRKIGDRQIIYYACSKIVFKG